jgi:hypothetical protein
MYNYHLHGGPRDGEVSNGFRPYYQLEIDGNIYEVQNSDASPDEYVEWVNDGTRKIELYWKAAAAEKGEERWPIFGISCNLLT